jgi:hypothetical protein
MSGAGDPDHRAITDLERRLKAARERCRAAPFEDYLVRDEEVKTLERLVAAAKGEEYAEPIPCAVRWDIGAPLPHLLVNDYRALLAFVLREPDPEWDGSYVRVVDPASTEPEPLALVEFERCVSAKLGSPNDEVFRGHPLHGKGLSSYTAQRVVNSRWLKEIEAINSVHRQYRPSSWADLQHFIFGFHDSTFECLAESFKVEVHRQPMRDLLNRMVDRLIT